MCPRPPKAADKGRALFGTIESWIIWWLTGGTAGGAHVTDVTNASRTLLMDLKTLAWDADILNPGRSPQDAAAHRAVH
jgi:glycerol kinase